MNVVIEEQTDCESVKDENLSQFQKAACLIFAYEGIPDEPVEIGLSFVSEEKICRMNTLYRGKDKLTDVLSFPMYENTDEIRHAVLSAPEGPQEIVMIGDIVICEGVATRQAKEYGHSVEREILYLFIHSLFHLLGYDHESEDAVLVGIESGDDSVVEEGAGSKGKQAMRRAEKEVLRQIDIV